MTLLCFLNGIVLCILINKPILNITTYIDIDVNLTSKSMNNSPGRISSFVLWDLGSGACFGDESINRVRDNGDGRYSSSLRGI